MSLGVGGGAGVASFDLERASRRSPVVMAQLASLGLLLLLLLTATQVSGRAGGPISPLERGSSTSEQYSTVLI